MGQPHLLAVQVHARVIHIVPRQQTAFNRRNAGRAMNARQRQLQRFPHLDRGLPARDGGGQTTGAGRCCWGFGQAHDAACSAVRGMRRRKAVPSSAVISSQSVQ